MESAVRTGNIGSIVGETKQSERDCVERVLQIGAARRAVDVDAFARAGSKRAHERLFTLQSLLPNELYYDGAHV